MGRCRRILVGRDLRLRAKPLPNPTTVLGQETSFRESKLRGIFCDVVNLSRRSFLPQSPTFYNQRRGQSQNETQTRGTRSATGLGVYSGSVDDRTRPLTVQFLRGGLRLCDSRIVRSRPRNRERDRRQSRRTWRVLLQSCGNGFP